MNYSSLLAKVYDDQLIKYLEENRDVFLGTYEEFGLDLFLAEGFYSDSPDSQLTVLNEELTDHEKYKADRMKEGGHSHYMSDFLSHNPVAKAEFEKQRDSEKPGRIRFPVTLDASTATPNEHVRRFLSMVGYSTDKDSYRQGLAHKTVEVGAPEKGIPMREKKVSKRIGGLLDELNAETRVKKAFMNDPARASSTKGNDFDVVISHHPHDVYGMSTDRGWTSCASMRPSERTSDNAARKMPEEINNQTHVAYLVPRGGEPDTDAIGRISLKQHRGILTGHKTLVPETTVYSGGAPHGFQAEVNRLSAHLFPVHSGDIYKKNSEVYNDNGKSWHVPSGNVPAEALDAAWKTTKSDDDDRAKLALHVQPNTKYKSTNLNKISKAKGELHDAIASGDYIKSKRAMFNYENSMDRQSFNKVMIDPDHHENVRKIADMMDHTNPDHMKEHKTILGQSGREITAMTHHVISKKPLNTLNDVVDNVRYHTDNGKRIYDRISYSDRATIPVNHKIGGHAFKKIASELGKHDLLSHETASHTFLSLPETSRRGNLYDNIVGLQDHPDVQGAHQLIDETVEHMKKKHPKEQSSIFFHSRPDTTKILASKMGVDHKVVMKPYIAELKQRDAEIKALIAKK